MFCGILKEMRGREIFDRRSHNSCSILLRVGRATKMAVIFFAEVFQITSRFVLARKKKWGYVHFKEAFKGFHQRFELRTSNILPGVWFVGLSVKRPRWFLDAKWLRNLYCHVALEVYSEVPTCLTWAVLWFSRPFYRKGYVKPCSADELRRIQGILLAELLLLFRTAVVAVRSW